VGDSLLDAHRHVVEYLGGPVPVVDAELTEEDLDSFLPDMFARHQPPVRSRAHTTAELNVVISGSSGGLILRPRP
jgi:hypothetical protein